MFVFFFFKQKTAYEMRISDWSSYVCSSDLCTEAAARLVEQRRGNARWRFVARPGRDHRELAHAVEDRFALVDLEALDRQRALAEDQVNAGVDQGAGGLALVFRDCRRVLKYAPVAAHDDDVGPLLKRRHAFDQGTVIVAVDESADVDRKSKRLNSSH